MLLIYPRKTILPNIVSKVNKIAHAIVVCYVTETNNILHFLDMMLHRTDNDLKQRVHRKSTDKNDFINV